MFKRIKKEITWGGKKLSLELALEIIEIKSNNVKKKK